jgi:type II secretory pathway pseudopilin PulG
MKPWRRPHQARGAVLMGLMVLLALGGMAAAQFTESAAGARQREREAELIWTGLQFQRALESYYLASPGRVRHLPVTLEDLVRDSRFPQPVRHLRRLYADPLQPDVPWGIVKRGNQIIGVYSQSDRETLRRSGFPAGLDTFNGTRHYAEWQFIFVPRAPLGVTSPAPRAKSSPTSANTATS